MKKLSVLLFLLGCYPLNALAATAAPRAMLTNAEQSYYDKVFSYTMEATKPGEHYDWASHSGKGSISVSEAYVSKSGSTCRNFTESYSIHEQLGKGEGVACKRIGKEGWCKLKTTHALTCSMEELHRTLNLNVPVVGDVTVPSINMDGNMGHVGNPNAALDTNLNVDPGKAPSGADVADTVTGAAGSVAGPVTGGLIGWFSDTFR